MKIKNLAKFATSDYQKYAANINSVPLPIRQIITVHSVRGRAAVAMYGLDANTNLTFPIVDNIIYGVTKRREILHKHSDKRTMSNRLEKELIKTKNQLRLLRSIKIMMQKYEKHKLMKFTGVMKSVPQLKALSKKARNSYWKPGGKGHSTLMNKYKQ